MPKKKQKTKKRFSVRTIWLTIIIGGLLIFIIGNFIASTVSQKKLENKFSQLEESLDDISGELVKNSPGTTVKKDKYCFRESFKLSEGPLKCAILIKQTLLAKNYIEKTASTIEAQADWVEVSKTPEDKTFTTKYYENKETGSKCRLDFDEDNTDEANPKYSFEFFCSELSDRAFYKYREN